MCSYTKRADLVTGMQAVLGSAPWLGGQPQVAYSEFPWGGQL